MTKMMTILTAVILLTGPVALFAEGAGHGHEGHEAGIENTEKSQPESGDPAAAKDPAAKADKKNCACCAGGDEEGTAAKASVKASYACPMGCARADKPGKCPKCGMDMKEVKAAAAKKYACPMKCAESDKPGKCPKCGMNMKEVKATAAKKYACPMGCAESAKPGKCPKCGMAMTEKKAK